MLLVGNIGFCRPRSVAPRVGPAGNREQMDGQTISPSGSVEPHCKGDFAMTQLAVAMAVYLTLIAGLALHGLDVPDPTPTSSVGNQFTDVPAIWPERRDRE